MEIGSKCNIASLCHYRHILRIIYIAQCLFIQCAILQFNSEDDRDDINNWRNNQDLVGSVSYESRRVPKAIWEFVSNLDCVEPNFEVPKVTCVQDSDCFDGNSCTIDECLVLEGECV